MRKIVLILVSLILIQLTSCDNSTYAQPSQTPVPEGLEVAEAMETKLHDLEQQTIQQFEQLAPSVVYVTNLAVRRVGFSRDVTSIPQGTGSGFIWDKNGTIITNFHVVNGAQDVEVTLADGSVWKAKPVGFEPEKDLAVIAIDAPADKLKPIPVGRSAGLKVGQHVMAIGNPFGFDHTLTTGIISGLDREIRSPTQRPIQGVIQTDAAINPGNSGGPLLDSSGRLIGMNTAIYSPSGAYAGIGFAVPVDHISRSVPEILEHGKVTKPGLGVTVASPTIARRLKLEGLLILDIVPRGPAEKAGLRSTSRTRFGEVRLGDVILRIDDSPMKNVDDLYRFLDLKKVGDKVTVEFLREGKTEQAEVTLERVN
ncbi:MAG: trypsin-like peptidase domain-containing protein [Vulcanimicrobiota bacterium]